MYYYHLVSVAEIDLLTCVFFDSFVAGGEKVLDRPHFLMYWTSIPETPGHFGHFPALRHDIS